jgi:hypothetical protein
MRESRRWILLWLFAKVRLLFIRPIRSLGMRWCEMSRSIRVRLWRNGMEGVAKWEP